MGQLLSKLGLSSSTITPETATPTEQKVAAAQELIAAGIEVTDTDIKDKLLEEEQKAKEEAAQKQKELEDQLEEEKRKGDAKSLKYYKAASLVFALLHNCPFGNTIDLGEEWSKPMQSFLASMLEDVAGESQKMSVEIFWLLCNFPILLPFLWPYGENDGVFHEYETDSVTNTAKTDNYKALLDANIEAYINGNFKTYCQTLFKSNCYQHMINKPDELSAAYKTYMEFATSIKDAKDDAEFISRMNTEIRRQCSEDLRVGFFYKLSTARARKGICAKTVKLLPSNFPKRSYEYEFFEGMMIITNCLINFYGVYDKTRSKYDGKCFKSNYMGKSGNKALTDTAWDGTFITTEQINLPASAIVGETTDWQTSIFAPDDTVESYTEYSPVDGE
jgi:hypothetical protein